jgi:YD repeat-containing protein
MKNILGKNENLELFNEQGKKVYDYYKNSNGVWSERTYDEKGNILTYKKSDGYWYEYTYDEKGNELTYKNSNGVTRGFDTP